MSDREADQTVADVSTENGELPEGWELTTVASAFELNPRKVPKEALPEDAPVTFVPMPAVDAETGTIAAPQPQPFGKVRKGYTSFIENDVIVAKITPCMENGKAAIARGLTNGHGFGSTEFHVLRPTGVAIPEYVYHFVRQESVRNEAESQMRGAVGQKRVPPEFFENEPFPLPPLAEQKRIVAQVESLLSRASAARERLVKVPSLLARLRQSVLAAACSGQLTADWREEHPELDAANLLQDVLRQRRERSEQKSKRKHYDAPLEPDLTDLPEIPKSWTWSTLDQLIAEGPQNGLYKPKSAYGDGAPIVRIDDFQNDFIRPRDELLKLRVTEDEAEKYALQAGELIINRVNRPSHIGKCMIVPSDLCPAIFESNMMAMTVSPSIEPRWILTYLQSADGHERLTVNAKWAVNQVSINQIDVRSTPVPLPPLSEQQEIVRRVESLFGLTQQVERRLDRSRAAAAALVQSILRSAFRGEMVETEADVARREGHAYEPACELLARIKQSRESVAVLKKRRRQAR